ncbi:hypothetical protein ACFL4N_02745 [Thermodesulfobacteriota bacterium]
MDKNGPKRGALKKLQKTTKLRLPKTFEISKGFNEGGIDKTIDSSHNQGFDGSSPGHCAM